jgi:hypothetical protein
MNRGVGFRVITRIAPVFDFHREKKQKLCHEKKCLNIDIFRIIKKFPGHTPNPERTTKIYMRQRPSPQHRQSLAPWSANRQNKNILYEIKLIDYLSEGMGGIATVLGRVAYEKNDTVYFYFTPSVSSLFT